MNSTPLGIIPQPTGELINSLTIQAIVQRMLDSFVIEKIILFGSYASGQATPDSDLDFLVVMETGLPSHKRATPLRLLFRPMPCSMDILVYTPEEIDYWKGTVNHIITAAFETGSLLYERSTVGTSPSLADSSRS
jgi:uncharacterized protein